MGERASECQPDEDDSAKASEGGAAAEGGCTTKNNDAAPRAWARRAQRHLAAIEWALDRSGALQAGLSARPCGGSRLTGALSSLAR